MQDGFREHQINNLKNAIVSHEETKDKLQAQITNHIAQQNEKDLLIQELKHKHKIAMERKKHFIKRHKKSLEQLQEHQRALEDAQNRHTEFQKHINNHEDRSQVMLQHLINYAQQMNQQQVNISAGITADIRFVKNLAKNKVGIFRRLF